MNNISNIVTNTSNALKDTLNGTKNAFKNKEPTKTELKNGSERLKKWDTFFNYYINLDTINVIEGLTAALVWGILITQLKFIIKLNPVYTNILAYLLSWYSQRMVIYYWKRTELFRKKTKDEAFLKNEGVDHIRDYYDQHNIIHKESHEKEPDRYHLIDEDYF